MKFQDSRLEFVFDDLMDEVTKSKWASKLYTAGCHHQNLSVISLQQKIFAAG